MFGKENIHPHRVMPVMKISPANSLHEIIIMNFTEATCEVQNLIIREIIESVPLSTDINKAFSVPGKEQGSVVPRKTKRPERKYSGIEEPLG